MKKNAPFLVIQYRTRYRLFSILCEKILHQLSACVVHVRGLNPITPYPQLKSEMLCFTFCN